MKICHFMVACVAAIVSASLGDCLIACEKCDSNRRSPVCCNDRGLLDVLASATGKLIPAKPLFSLTKGPACDVGGCQPTCGCETQPTCGCETRPDCGCETQPSCGCEAQPSCGCETIPGQLLPHEVTGAARLMLQPQGSGVRQPNPPLTPSPNRSIPAQVPVPLPDSLVDPFTDDTAARIRRLPTPVNHAYQTQASKSSSRLDPHGNQVIHRRLSDHSSSPSTRLTAIARDTATPDKSSSVQPATANVVTVSRNEPQELGAAKARSQPQRLPSRSATTYPVNPLRGN
jgi:hypothetical protein